MTPPAWLEGLAVALVAAIVAGLIGGVELRAPAAAGDEAAGSGRVLEEPKPLPAFSLVDQNQAPFDRARLEGRWSLLFFGYASCPDVCPLVLQELGRAMEAWRRQSVSEIPQVVFVSVDPEHDTPGRLDEYLRFFDPAFVGVSGDATELARLAGGVGAFYRVRGEEGGRRVDHSSRLFLVSPALELVAILEEPRDPQAFARRLAKIQAGRGSR